MRRIFLSVLPFLLVSIGTAQTVAAAEEVMGIVPVVGSVAGSFGSHFKTSLQLLNAYGDKASSGRLVFHPAGAPASSGDPSIPFSIPPSSVLSFDDVVAAMGQSGLGSLDVVMPVGVYAPVTVARIFNDAGSGGTSGLAVSALYPYLNGWGRNVLAAGQLGCLVTPIDPVRTRFNIGVRSLSSGAEVRFELKARDGRTLTTVSKSYGPDFFEQTDVATFFGGRAVTGDEWIRVNVVSGGIIVYGATTDNVTNDPAVQFALGMNN